MGDMGDYFNDVKDHKKRLRAKYGIACPVCRVKRPKACPTILLPQQRCKVDGNVDARPRLTNQQYQDA